MKTDNYRTPADRATATLLDRTSVTMPSNLHLCAPRSPLPSPSPLLSTLSSCPLIGRKPSNFLNTRATLTLIHAEIRVDQKTSSTPRPRESAWPNLDTERGGGGFSLLVGAGVGRGGSCPWTFLGVVKWSAEWEKEGETGEKEYERVSVKRVEEGWRRRGKRERGGWKKRRQNDETARWMKKVWSLRGRRREG